MVEEVSEMPRIVKKTIELDQDCTFLAVMCYKQKSSIICLRG